ncbi:myosin light chain kinase family member 4 [Capricornis sumatraensis]|uniref:myosin light chain kinase family member 4 n=1 Tax=Capricornis sumatraensis TaxID=34865 RepID=UPI0036049739
MPDLHLESHMVGAGVDGHRVTPNAKWRLVNRSARGAGASRISRERSSQKNLPSSEEETFNKLDEKQAEKTPASLARRNSATFQTERPHDEPGDSALRNSAEPREMNVWCSKRRKRGFALRESLVKEELKKTEDPRCHTDQGRPGVHVKSSVLIELRVVNPTKADALAPPAPFDHRIVTARQAAVNSFYTVSRTEILGGGRFGQVHKCEEKATGLKLAAKIIKTRGMKDKDDVKNEISVMNQLDHVNLIQLYDAFESKNDIVLVMEYVGGGELFDRIIDDNCSLTELDTILFIRQICEGIRHMHQMYILHLDLKPENILCVNRDTKQIKIIDFGLARRYKPREKLKVNFGTPEFLAPEVVNYDFVSFPTDMWSVGVITYMLLSGLSPFLGDDNAETLNNILACRWDLEDQEFQDVSEEAREFISKLLIKEKSWRISASEALKHPWLADHKLHSRLSTQHNRVYTDLPLPVRSRFSEASGMLPPGYGLPFAPERLSLLVSPLELYLQPEPHPQATWAHGACTGASPPPAFNMQDPFLSHRK